MKGRQGSQGILGWAIILLSTAAWMMVATMHAGRFVHAGQMAAPSAHTIKLGTAQPGSLYAITLGVKDPAQFQGNDSVLATVSDAQGEV